VVVVVQVLLAKTEHVVVQAVLVLYFQLYQLH
jgi:hypothetical protein